MKADSSRTNSVVLGLVSGGLFIGAIASITFSKPTGILLGMGGTALLTLSCASHLRFIASQKKLENTYQLSLVSNDKGFWNWDIVANQLTYSDHCRTLLGYSREEFPDQISSFIEKIHPEDLEGVRAAIQRHVQEKEPYHIQYRLLGKDGEYRWYEVQGQARWSESGEPLQMVGWISDVAGRRANEDEAAHRQFLKSEFFKNSPINLALYRAVRDANGNIIDFSIEDTNHRKGPDKVTQQTKGFRFREFYGQETLDEWLPVLQGIAQTGISVTREHWFEPLKRFYSSSIFWLGDDYFGVSAVDIHERIISEQNWSESEQRLRKIIESTAVGMLLYDLRDDDQLILTATNRATDQLLNIDTSPLIGLPIEEAFPELQYSDNPERYRLAAKYGEPFVPEEHVYSFNGKDIFFEVHAFQAGQNRVVVQLIDITQRKESELALIEREREFRTLAENSPDVIIRYDSQGRRTFVNEAYERSTGQLRNNVIGQQPSEYANSSQEVTDFGQALHSVLETGVSAEVLIEWSDPSGLVTTQAVRIVPERNVEGKTVGALAIGRNVQELIDVQNKLRESEIRYREVFENTAEMIFVIDVTEEGRFKFANVNPAWEQVVGKKNDEIQGRFIEDCMRQETVEQATPRYWECIERAEPISFELGLTTFQGFRYFITTVVPVKDATGRIHRLFGISRDVTQQRLAEQAMRNVLRHARTMVMSSIVTAPEGWEAHGPEWAAGKFEWVSYFPDEESARIVLPLEMREGEAYSAAWGRARHPDDRPPTDLTAARAFYSNAPHWNQEFRVRDLFGNLRWFMQSASVELITPGKWTVTTINTDISDRKWIEEEIHQLNSELELRVIDRTKQLEIANRELEAFSYSVSHDLRSPLRAIAGFNTFLTTFVNEKGGEDEQHCVQRIHAATIRMSEIIDSLLALSRLSRKKMEVRLLDLSDIVQSIARELSEAYPTRKFDWRIQDATRVLGDESLITALLHNLLENAVKYTRDREVAIIEFGESKKTSSNLEFFVRDNGAGFEMEGAERMFHAFERLHSSKKFEGTGIGLATAQRIVAMHGGSVRAEGVVDEGATIYFELSRNYSAKPELL